MRLRISAFICCATAEFDSSSVSWQVGQTSSVSSSLSLGCASDASTGAATRARAPRRPRRRRRAASRLQGAADARGQRFGERVPSTCGGISLPRRSTKNVCGVPVDAVRPDRDAVRVEDDRIGRAVALEKGAGRALEVDDIDPDERCWPAYRRAAASSRGISCLHGWQSEAQKLTTTTFPRSDARLSLPGPFRRARSKAGARDDLLVGDLLLGARRLMGHAPREHAARITTPVPARTRSPSTTGRRVTTRAPA